MSLKSTYIILFSILLFASFLRFYHIGNFGIFGDEKQGIMVAVGNVNIGGQKEYMSPDKTFTPKDFWRSKTMTELLDANARGDTSGNAIVHLFSMSTFGKLFGRSDLSLRSVSVIFNLLTILIIFLIGKNILKSTKIGLMAAFLASIEPFFIVYSQQARFYTTAIFFSTLASYYFLQIVFSPKSNTNVYLKYTLTLILSLFSNYLTFTMLIVHGLFWLITDRSIEKLKKLSACYVIMLIPFLLWMTQGPGQYAIQYIKDATNLYNSILNNPKLAASYSSFVERANFENLSKRSISILSDFFIFTNGTYQSLGFKFAFLLLIIFVIFTSFLILYRATATDRKIFIFVTLIISIPFLFTLSSAYKTGLMTGFYFRYAALGLPFVSILTAWLIDKTTQIHKLITLCLSALLFFQIYQIAEILQDFYQDKPQKYAPSNNRIFNPYMTLAEKIEKRYSLGDTILYPSLYQNVFSTAIKKDINDFDNIDAQLTNLYLPEDATYIQRINTNEKNRVILVKKNHQKFILFDFQDRKYRY